MPNPPICETLHLDQRKLPAEVFERISGRGHLIDLIRIFENENPGLPMRVDHGRMMLGDEDKGYNPGYSFHGRMLALAQVEGMMAVVDDEKRRQIIL